MLLLLALCPCLVDCPSPHPCRRAQGTSTPHCYNRRERPQLLIENGVPTLLCTGVLQRDPNIEREKRAKKSKDPNFGQVSFSLCSKILP